MGFTGTGRHDRDHDGGHLPERRPGLDRLVVVLVVATVTLVALVALAVALNVETSTFTDAIRDVTVGPVTVAVSDIGPSTTLLLLAGGGILIVAAGALLFEGLSSLLIGRSTRDYLGGRRRMRIVGATGPVRVTVLIPAHDEEEKLPAALDSLERQTRRPERVIVVADNCTDRTVAIARARGYDVFETVGNTLKKGGALNQMLGRELPDAEPEDCFLVMDADTQLDSGYLEAACRVLDEDRDVAAVGGVFFGEGGHGMLGQLQRNEYTRYSAEIGRRRGRVFVLTGTASVFRAEVLLDVAAARGIRIPGTPGKVYDTSALTEDNELTLALKSLGAAMVSPKECGVTTELMPTWRELWQQRKRWQRGALENLGAYGITSTTIRYWGQQLGIGYGAVALSSAMALMLITIVAVDRWIWFPFWLAVAGVFLIERVATVWKGGRRARLLALPLLPELVYDLYLQAVFVSCLVDITLRRRARWGHERLIGAPEEAR